MVETSWYRKPCKKNVIAHSVMFKIDVLRTTKLEAVSIGNSKDNRQRAIQKAEATAKKSMYNGLRFRPPLYARRNT